MSSSLAGFTGGSSGRSQHESPSIPFAGDDRFSGASVCRVLVANGKPVLPGAEVILRRAEERGESFKPEGKFPFIPRTPTPAPKRPRNTRPTFRKFTWRPDLTPDLVRSMLASGGPENTPMSAGALAAQLGVSRRTVMSRKKGV